MRKLSLSASERLSWSIGSVSPDLPIFADCHEETYFVADGDYLIAFDSYEDAEDYLASSEEEIRMDNTNGE